MPPPPAAGGAAAKAPKPTPPRWSNSGCWRCNASCWEAVRSANNGDAADADGDEEGENDCKKVPAEAEAAWP